MSCVRCGECFMSSLCGRVLRYALVTSVERAAVGKCPSRQHTSVARQNGSFRPGGNCMPAVTAAIFSEICASTL